MAWWSHKREFTLQRGSSRGETWMRCRSKNVLRLPTGLRRISRWVLAGLSNAILIRDEYAEYAPETDAWPEPVSLLVEEERRCRFNLSGMDAATRLSRYYFCLSYECQSVQRSHSAAAGHQ